MLLIPVRTTRIYRMKSEKFVQLMILQTSINNSNDYRRSNRCFRMNFRMPVLVCIAVSQAIKNIYEIDSFCRFNLDSFGRPSSSPSERLDSVDSPLHLNLDLSESPRYGSSNVWPLLNQLIVFVFLRVELPGLTPGISEEIQANFNYDHPVLKNPENLAQLVEAIKGIVNLSQRVQEAKNECLALKVFSLSQHCFF